MADGLVGKIKIMRSYLEQFRKRMTTFGSIDKSFKDSEVFLNLQITDMNEDYQKAKAVNSEIAATSDLTIADFSEYVQDKVFYAITNIYFKHSTTLHELLKIVSKSDRHDITFTEATQSAFQRINMNTSSHHTQFDVGLAYLQGSVPEFDGSYDKWAEFMDSYINEVHENNGLSDCAKLKILKSLLKGDASKVIKREFGTSLQSKDYQSIWLKLTKRYNHKKAIVYAYFQDLFFQPHYDKESAANLKSLYDTSYDSIQGLHNLGLETEHWGDILLFLVYSKLPIKTKGLWDERLTKPDSLPEWKNFLEFLEHRFRTLESLESASSIKSIGFNGKGVVQKKVSTLHTTSHEKKNSTDGQGHIKNSCKCCNKGVHALRKCFRFKKMKPQERFELVKSIGYCLNCLSFSHKLSTCTSEFRCENCSEKHNSLLCLKHKKINNEVEINTPENSATFANTSVDPSAVQSTSDGRFARVSERSAFASSVSESELNENTIFPTALVKVINESGNYEILRALIDNCSDASYITESAARRLKLPLKCIELQVAGLGNTPTAKTAGMVDFKVQSLIDGEFVKPLSAFVLSSISPCRPSRNFKLNENLTNYRNLADPTFNKKSRIDLLLGGSVDAMIHKNGSFKLVKDNIILRETHLGWIVSGSVSELNCFSSIVLKQDPKNVEKLEFMYKELDKSIQRFWEVEELPGSSRMLTSDEKLCEHIFDHTTLRLSSGRYSVSLPFKGQLKGFTNMRNIALSRFSQLERKLYRDPELHKVYKECMDQYIELQHMTQINHLKYPDGYYIPHHCVIKDSSTTTKLRVVYDASAKDSNLQSLNDNLLNGPRLQFELLDHLIRFRTFKVAFSADIEKMYRQIEINPNDRMFQLVLWRSHPGEDIKTYCLNTVTFGTKSAPYLAVKTLMRLSEDEKKNFPDGSVCLKEGFYVDDCIYGADDVPKALKIQSEIINILKTGGFHIRKWSTNKRELLLSIPEADRETDIVKDFDAKVSVKTLGVQWCPVEDCFRYKLTFTSHSSVTKRSILSDLAKVFDPLGWIVPCLITAKLLIQKLWSLSCGWDSEVDVEIADDWRDLCKGLEYLTDKIRLPRWLQTLSDGYVEVHGFSDASTRAYSIAIYIKTILDGKVYVNLLCSKSKVAPLKTISLPRLELMGAVMLAKMMSHLKKILSFPNCKYFYWSDSQIVLAWLNDEPNKRTVFVANRITEVQDLSAPSSWHYVESKCNPADLGTRGIPPADLLNLSLWWNGPEFLNSILTEQTPFQSDGNFILPVEDNVKSKQTAKKNPDAIVQTLLSQMKSTMTEVSSNLMKLPIEFLNKYSTLSKLVRVIAFCLRIRFRSDHSFITPIEYERALMCLLRMVQEAAFAQELIDIQSDGVSKQSSIYSLNAFLNDNDKLLRVSGRLKNADHINYDQKHPIILPYAHAVTKLIVRHAHLSTMHGTEQQTIMLISQRYHIVKCKSLVKIVIHKCVRCFKLKCAIQAQLMGQLPKYRVTPNRPFLNTGVDFAGPFNIKKFKGRCQTSYKSWFAIFVCFATKAVHLEVVIDLSTPAFIAAYRRFTSRRGLCRNLYSDCGTNMMGARSTVTRSISQVQDQWNENISKELANFQTTWHNNPPGAPHFGGLWEAGVKSCKHHLKRIIGDLRLTYDEFETVLVQAEACMNSRPLCEIRNASESLVITPAHFLIQDSLLTLPDDNLLTKTISILDRWNIVQKVVQDFWNIWNKEYLNTLNQRQKWKTIKDNVKVNDIVILKENNLPPSSWALAKVLETYPGEDKLVRVVLLKTEKSIIKRPITKICVLPIETD